MAIFTRPKTKIIFVSFQDTFEISAACFYILRMIYMAVRRGTLTHNIRFSFNVGTTEYPATVDVLHNEERIHHLDLPDGISVNRLVEIVEMKVLAHLMGSWVGENHNVGASHQGTTLEITLTERQ